MLIGLRSFHKLKVCVFWSLLVLAFMYGKVTVYATCKNETGCCRRVEVKYYTSAYTNDFDSVGYVDLDNGESICTVGTKEFSDFGTSSYYTVPAIIKCNNSTPEPPILNNNTVSILTSVCKDNRQGSDLSKNVDYKAEFVEGVKEKSVDYIDQNLRNVTVRCVHNTTLIGSVYCTDTKTKAMCMTDGHIVKTGGCTGNTVCKMENGSASCVEPICTENGVTGVFGESKCVPSNGEDINSKKVVKRCFIGGFVLTDECTNKPQCIDNGGAAICSSSATQSCHGSDVNKPELGDLAPGSSNCDSNNTIWNCGTDSKFKQGTDCSKTSAPYCYTQSVPDGSNNSTKLIAFCSNKSADELTDDEKKTILNLTVKRGTGFWCSEDKNNLKIQTALGCVPITATGVVGVLLPMLFGVAGAISFLLMVYGFILVATSSGDEKKLMGARDTISSAITGLLVSIFAIFLFRLIAVNILKIPGL